MAMWNRPLNRDNFDDFYRLLSPPAYRSTYKLLGDSTRTEKVLVDSFVTVYQKRKEIEPEELSFAFGSLLQDKIEQQIEIFSVRETAATSNRTLDEFTQSSMLLEIHKQMDSVVNRLLEMVVGGFSSSNKSKNSVSGLFSSSGLSLLNIIQFIILALVIFAVTTFGIARFVNNTKNIPPSVVGGSFSVADVIVEALPYYPVIRDVPINDVSPEAQNPVENDEEGTTPSDDVAGTDESSQGEESEPEGTQAPSA